MDHFGKIWLLGTTIIVYGMTITNCGSNPNVCDKVFKLEALPGHGWDSLRNKELGRVLEFTYDQCRTTEDGMYLIPDSVHAVAIKDSVLETTADLFEHYMNYSSLTAASFDIGVGYHFAGVGVEASFDSDYLNAKRRQVSEKSFTTRIQARNNIYMIQSQPDAKIDPALKRMFDRVIEATQSNDHRKAKLLCQFIVRDYGTHYIDQANAGAILLKEDYLSSNLIKDGKVNKLEIQAAAGAEFFSIFSAHTKFSFKDNTESQETYKNSKTSSHIRAIGGAILTTNMTLEDWTQQIGNNLVVIDRSGDPLSYLVNPERFPDVPVDTLNTVRKRLDLVTKHYYAHNAHHGCTDINSPNFDFNANVDSNDCQNIDNYSFGAGYMTCTSYKTGNDVWCAGYRVKNPLTGDFKCEDGYEAIRITSNYREICMIFRWFCDSTYYEGFWCVSKTPARNNSGAMFGGLYTGRTNNPMTKAKNCPVSFLALRLTEDLYVCVSNAYDEARANSAPFGGFFTCKVGNPLIKAPEMQQNKSNAVQGKRNLHTCPPGFSQRVAAIEDDCLINYCTKLEPTIGSIKIILPPFQGRSAPFGDSNGQTSLNLASKSDAGRDSMSGESVAFIVIGTLAVFVLMVVGVLVVKRRRQRLDVEREGILHSGDYGSTNATGEA